MIDACQLFLDKEDKSGRKIVHLIIEHDVKKDTITCYQGGTTLKSSQWAYVKHCADGFFDKAIEDTSNNFTTND